MPRLALSLFVALALLAGCDPAKFATPQEQATAKAWLQQLRDHRFDAIDAGADTDLRSNDLHGALQRMADLIPPGEPTSVALVGDQHFVTPHDSTVNLSYEYGYGERYILATSRSGRATASLACGDRRAAAPWPARRAAPVRAGRARARRLPGARRSRRPCRC